MKRLLFLVIAIAIAGSTYDYATSAGHYGILVVAGVVIALLMVGRAVNG
ncbi:hypothetical protein GPX89_24025 [Nocardia sp. ET3-3]|uniref:DUF3309 family protein n=1 Tax=Nocardia terrae TaxID=2675851 RepID=A0A7K1V0Y9_9NOCA|nr:hypothetical protein [Nocardia terrae]MVU80303.1 hypothetical protein [Nocardia terrae]